MLPEGGFLDDKNIVFLVGQKVQRSASNWSVFKDLKKSPLWNQNGQFTGYQKGVFQKKKS